MDQTGPASLPLPPLIGWADWALIGLIGLCSLAAEVAGYLSGVYWDSKAWFFGSLGWHFIALVLGITLLYIPVISPRKGGLALRLIIRAGLMALGFGIWYLPNLISQTPPHIRGCKHAFESVLTSADFAELRTYAQRMKGQQPTVIGSADDKSLPANFKLLNRSVAPRMEVYPDAQSSRVQIDVFWGGGLTGYHGLMIDPAEPPLLGLSENGSGDLRWHFKLGDGVYFYFTNG